MSLTLPNAFEIRPCLSNFIPCFYVSAVTYPCRIVNRFNKSSDALIVSHLGIGARDTGSLPFVQGQFDKSNMNEIRLGLLYC